MMGGSSSRALVSLLLRRRLWLQRNSNARAGRLREALQRREARLCSLQQLGAALAKRKLATGLAAAWLHTGFAGFRLVTFYLGSQPDDAFRKDVGFREESKGANVWLVVPNDEGVFDGARKVGGVACVHPVQAYVDLL